MWSQFTNVTDRRTDRQTTCDRNTALCTKVHRAVKTSTQLSRCCWVRKTNLRATEQSEKFHARWGIHRSSVSWIIHKDLRLKCCKKRYAQQLTEAALFSVCSSRDDNITNKQTYMKTEHSNSILEPFEYFCQMSSKLTHIILSYTVSKLGHFLRHSVLDLLLKPQL